MDTKVIIAADELRKSGISVLITDAMKNPVGGKWKEFENRLQPGKSWIGVVPHRMLVV